MICGIGLSLVVAGLSVSLYVPKADIVVGEPVKAVATWRSTLDQAVGLDEASIWIDDGTGYREYSESSLGTSFGLSAMTMPSNVPFKTNYVLAVAGRRDADGVGNFHFAFGSPGTYRLRVRYETIESNEVTLTVRTPSATDAAVFTTYLRPRPELLTEWGVLEDADVATLSGVLEQHRGSPYLYWPQVLVWKRRTRDALAAFGASGGRILQGDNPLVADLGQVVGEIEANDWNGTPFDEDRLLLVAATKLAWGARVAALETYREIIARYPDGVASQEARAIVAEEADNTPPSPQVSASPASLWPPNHKLVPITVAVTVSDDTDPNPKVKLVSITCNDSCNPAQDIAGAALNTDDRAFQLAAWRTGSGSGRTYTITYSATDASGNSTTTKTTVVVPHDQGD
jgi:hypothetical protein